MSTPVVRDVVVRGDASGFLQEIAVGPHTMLSDEPVDAGGTDRGPTPYDLIAAALGSCTSMTIALVARRKQWPLESVQVQVRHSKVHAADCASCETKDGRIDRLDRTIVLTGPLTGEQRQELLRIADRCPVHRTLTSEIQILTTLVPAAGA